MFTFIQNVKDVDFSVANIIYVQNDLHLNHEFTSKSAEVFGSSVIQVDFKEALNAVDRINSWIIEKTRNKIKDLITLGNYNLIIVFSLAIYFFLTYFYHLLFTLKYYFIFTTKWYNISG